MPTTALQLDASRLEDAESPCGAHPAGLAGETRLADAGRTLDPCAAPLLPACRVERLLDRRQLIGALY